MSLLPPHLQAFVEISRRQTVMAAAQALGITQTGVTQRIRALESQLGTTLFIRSRRGMRLTPEGEAILRYCEGAALLEGQTLARIQGAAVTTAARARIVAPSSVMRTRVVPACQGLLARFPQLLLSLELDDGSGAVEHLRRAEADFVILPRGEVVPELASRLLKPERYVIVVPRAWARRKLADIVESERIIDFNEGDPMTFNTLRASRLLDRARAERHYVNNNESLVSLVEVGAGYAVMTEEFAREYVRSRAIAVASGAAYDHAIALAWFERPEPPAYFQAIIKAIK